jgi:predicted RNase H-like HicB family nuclease
LVRRYKVVVTTDNTGRVSVTVPAIPGVHAEASTREQALQFAASVVTAHLKSLEASGSKSPDSDVDAIVVDI